MIIKVGSTNPQKIKAVSDTVSQYEFLNDAKVEGILVDTGVADQPKSLVETVEGAINRAKRAFVECDLSFGLESGIVEVPETKVGFMDLCVCAIWDGVQSHLGMSSAFEPPRKIMDLMQGGMNMTQAAVALGLSTNSTVGSSEGLVGILTKGRIDRYEQARQSVVNALIHLENRNLYE
jgi:inosine/xanthosine triphosphatase